jgi:hypothetical protein
MRVKTKPDIILYSCKSEFTASAEKVETIILGYIFKEPSEDTLKIRGKYTDYIDYLKFKESDKLYNKGIRIINFKENSDNYPILSLEDKNLLDQVALVYLQDADRINGKTPDYLSGINKLC